MFKLKRGQAAAGAAVLLAIIAGLIIMFVVLVPQDVRDDLLDDGKSTASGSTTAGKYLLKVSPGRVDYLAQKEIEHPLPTVNVYTETEGKVLARRNVAQATRGVFSEDSTTFSFVITDLSLTENIFLSFNVKEIQGNLIVTLNGDELYNAEPTGGVQPISIPQNSLQENNVMTFEVSSPGLVFWATNRASVENINIVGDVTSVAAQSSRNIFLMSETEYNNLEKVILEFQPQCNFGEVGPLLIRVNGNEIYNSVPDCGLEMVPIEFSSALVKVGENNIVFTANRGTYLLSHVNVVSELQKVDFPAYYFDISQEQYNDVKDGDRVRLKMDFVDVVTRNYGEVIFNGHTNNFDTKDVTFSVDVSEDVVLGTNSVKIKPRKTLEIRELRVDFVR
jgi:hypothetical protein